MDRRLLLVFALTFVIIIFFQPILKKYLTARRTGQATDSGPATGRSYFHSSPARCKSGQSGRPCTFPWNQSRKRRIRSRRRERSVSHRLQQPRCAGEVLGSEKV